MFESVKNVFVSSLTVVALTSCATSPQTLCSHDLPEILSDVEEAHQTWATQRGPAMIVSQEDGTSKRAPDLDPDERTSWKDWSEKHLSQIQGAMAHAVENGRSDQELQAFHNVANELVMLWGSAERGNPVGMEHSLERLSVLSHALNENACERH